MSIRHTRALLQRGAGRHACKNARYERDPFFGLLFPQDVPGIPNEVLNPRLSWADKAAYDRAARDLVARFEKNFANFHGVVTDEVKAAAIRAAA